MKGSAPGAITGRSNHTFGLSILLATTLGLGLTTLGVMLARQQNTQRLKQLLSLALANQVRILGVTFEFYEAIVYETRDRFSIHPQPTRAEFKKLADTILERAPEIESIAWIPVVTEAQRAEFEKSVRQEGFPDFRLFQKGPDGRVEASGLALEHLPIQFIEPMATNLRAFGYDMAFDRLAATLAKAQGSPRTVVSPLIELPERPGTPQCMATFKAVYDTLELDSKYSTSRQPRGYVAVFYYLPTFVPHILGHIADTNLDLLLTDDRATTNRVLAFRSAATSLIRTGGDDYPHSLFADDQSQSAELFVGKTTWRLSLHPSPQWLAARSSRSPWIIGGSGLAVTALVILQLIHAARRARQTEVEVALRTTELRAANAELQRQIETQFQAETALRKSQSTLLAAQRLGATGSWECDLVTNTLTWSETVYHIFGRNPDDFSPTNARFFEAVHENDRPTVLDAAKRSIQTGRPYHIEHRVRLPDGSVRHVQEHAEISRDSSGRSVRMIGAIRDITEHRLAEANLEKERAMLRAIIDAIPDSIYVKDTAGRFILQNRADLDHSGFQDASEGLGKTVFDITAKEVADIYNQDDWFVLRTATPVVNREEPFLRRRGGKGVFLTTKIPFRDASGQVAGLVGISRDVTEFKRMAEERQQFERHLNDAARLESLGVLAGGIAHDFNNLLTGVLGNASLLRLSVPSTAENLETIQGIENAADKAADLCRQMLAYAGKGRLTIRQFNLNSLILETTTLLRHSVAKTAKLIFCLEEAQLTVEGDETQLGQIVMNLVINASEALGGNPGTITITTGTQQASREYLTAPHLPRDLTEGMYAYIEVRDTGSGMSEETIAHIFEPFFTTKFAGRGLGLAAALGIVRSHLGALKVTSTPGVGTAFRLLLPLKCHPPSPDTKPLSEAEPRHLTASRILLVDDEAGVRKVAQKMLASLHCTVVEAVDGEEGLARFQATPDAFDVVLLDFTMPRLQGRQVAAAIWSLRPTTPVVFMSGYNEEEDSGAATAGPEAGTRGPSVFLHKPFSVAELTAKLHAARARGGADAAAKP